MCNTQSMKKMVLNIKNEPLSRQDLYDLFRENDMHFVTKWSTHVLLSKLVKAELLPYRNSLELSDYTKEDLLYAAVKKDPGFLALSSVTNENANSLTLDPRMNNSLLKTVTAITKLSETILNFSQEDQTNLTIERLNFKTVKLPNNEDESILGLATIRIKDCKVVINKQFGDSVFKEETQETTDVIVEYELYKNDNWRITECYTIPNKNKEAY